ncbi:lipoprotein-releasing ABC transporter permease subunit [Sphingomonas sp.]|uniref:lipoprotein-releasing ABC transporter permease subunit n=1 Tax=Sphingomonas sp. TaxID=28214 RepID=UPI003CC69661
MLLSRYERLIARRYLLPGKGERFIVLVAGLSLGAVMLGVAALVIVLSVMNGFRAELFDKIVGLNGHAVIQGVGGRLPDWREVVQAARHTPGVTSAVPLIEQPLAATYNGRAEAVLVRGMQLEDIRALGAKGQVIAGSLASITPGSNRIAIGSRLAEQLGAQPGSEIALFSPQGQTTPFGTVPRIVSYTVGAIFEIGVYDYDKAFIVMPIPDAQTLLLMGDDVGMVEIQTDDPDHVGRILRPLQGRIGGQAVIADWRSMNASLFDALAVERIMMFLVVGLVMLVAAFNIASALIMLARAKTRDIAILRTMGASRGAILRVFMVVGTSIGVLGTIAGLGLSVLFHFNRQAVVNAVQFVTGQNLWDPSIRYLTELPSKPNPLEVTVVVAMALFFSFAATLYPAWTAASTDPVQVLRYE